MTFKDRLGFKSVHRASFYQEICQQKIKQAHSLKFDVKLRSDQKKGKILGG